MMYEKETTMMLAAFPIMGRLMSIKLIWLLQRIQFMNIVALSLFTASLESALNTYHMRMKDFLMSHATFRNEIMVWIEDFIDGIISLKFE